MWVTSSRTSPRNLSVRVSDNLRDGTWEAVMHVIRVEGFTFYIDFYEEKGFQTLHIIVSATLFVQYLEASQQTSGYEVQGTKEDMSEN